MAERIDTITKTRGLKTAVLHTDDLCPGWEGLPTVPEKLHDIVGQLAQRGTATYVAWDWANDRAGATKELPAYDVVIIEGVAATDPRWAEQVSASVWVEAPTAIRKRRAIQRDGETFAAHWDQWATAEDAYFEARPTVQADFVVDMAGSVNISRKVSVHKRKFA